MRHPAELIAHAHGLGLMNLHVPAEYGGPGLSAFDGMLVGEEINWGCTGIGTSILANGLGSAPVILFGSPEQKARWLPPLAEQPILCSFGLSEPGAGSDVAALRSIAVRDGDEYVLNGSKTFITNAGHAEWSVVFAKTDPAGGRRGISAFIVRMGLPGVTIEKHLEKMGQRATDTSAFALHDVRVPAENRLGEEGEGFKIAMATLDFTRPGTAIGAVAVAQAAYEHLARWAVAGQVTQPTRSAPAAHDEIEVLRAAFLVQRASADTFLAELRSCVESREGVHCAYSGPWPPYSFAVPTEEDAP